MFKGLIQGPNHTEPWPWLQVDDVIEDWNDLLTDFKTYSPEHNEPTTGKARKGLLSVIMKDGDERLTPKLQEFVANAETWLDKNSKEILSYWPGGRGFNDLPTEVEVQITRQLPAPYRFNVHQESLLKYWSCVIYVQPDYGAGTGIYTGPEMKSRWGQCTWKPNRAFIFAGREGETYHDYEGVIDESRITVNLFIMKYKEKSL